MIRLEKLSKRYGDAFAVRDLDLEVRDGELCVLIGPSGCGKTTTLRMINRLVEPSSGRVLIDGRDARAVSAPRLRRGIGYAIQGVGLFPHLSVGENIAVVPRLLGWSRERVAARVDELLGVVGLDPARYRNARPRDLSGGQAQRVGVARALAADPPVLLMDEPFGAVDPLTRARLQDEFVALHRRLGKTVVFVTHDMDEAVRLADRLAIMRDGRLVQYDTPEAILERPADAFVRDFVGADRGLKRLARVSIRDAMSTVPTVTRLGDGLAAARRALERDAAPAVYVVDDAGRLLGWLQRDAAGATLEDAMSRRDPADVAVRDDASVREALSKLVTLGFQAMPVVDGAARLVGQFGFRDLERIARDAGSAETA